MLSRNLMLGERLVGGNVDTYEVNWKIMTTNRGNLVFISSSRRMTDVLCTDTHKIALSHLRALFFGIPNK